MKKLLILKTLTLLFISTISFYSCGNDDEPQEPTVDPNAIIEFTDPNFKATLLIHGTRIFSLDGKITIIDTNNDGEIQVKEAEAYTGRIYTGDLYRISDLTGLEYFKNITELFSSNGLLTSINVSENHKLEKIEIRDNQLTQIDLSKNPLLKELNVISNQLNILDLKNNPMLTTVYSSGNKLTSLNIANGNNQNLNIFETYSNPNLYCIQIDPNFTPPLNWNKDATASYSDNCQ